MKYTELKKRFSEVKKQSILLSRLTDEERNRILRKIAASLKKNAKKILSANKKDLANAGRKGKSSALIDRLTLKEKRIEVMA